MKFKPTNSAGGVVVEPGPKEAQLPTITARQMPAALPVFHLKKILVPVDFSACSKKALQYAIPFARQFGAELTILYVVQPFLPVPEMVTVDLATIESQMRQTGEQQLAALKATVDESVDCKTALRVGNPHGEIIEAAKTLGSDLIILSTHGHTGLAHVFLGSTAERVVRSADCPVLVVREKEHDFVAGRSAKL